MAIPPDAFLGMLETQIEGYQKMDSVQGISFSLGLLSELHLSKPTKWGLIGGGTIVNLPDSSVDGYDSRDTLVVGVEYPLEINPADSVDITEALNNTKPKGVVAYTGVARQENIITIFDLESETIDSIEHVMLSGKQNEDELSQIKEFKNVLQSVPRIFHLIYNPRGLKLR